MHDIEQEELEALGAKLGALELSEDERAMLDRILERASLYQPEVSGFDLRYEGLASGADLSPMSFKLGRGLGLFPTTLGLTEAGDWKPPPP